MVIDDARLFQGLTKNLADLASLASSPQAQAIIHSSQTIALELSRRGNDAHAARQYDAGRRLMVDAAAASPDMRPAKQLELTALLEELPDVMPWQLDFASREALFERIRRGIVVCFEGSKYPLVGDPRLLGVMNAMSEWERAGYTLKAPAISQSTTDQEIVVVDAATLQQYLRSHCRGYEDATVQSFTPIAGGFSKQTILFDADRTYGREGFVYRGATKIQIIEPVLVDIAQEFHVVSYAFSRGAPVAEPLWLQSDIGATGTRFFISRRVPGINLGSAVRAHGPVSAAATQSLGQALARIHAVALDSTDELLRKSHLRAPEPGVSIRDVIRGRVTEWRDYFRSLNAPSFPTLELAFEWLLENAAASDGDIPVLVHGDYGLHNILVHEDSVSAVLDWEACHLGDRALDLSHILAGTVGSMDHAVFMDAYVAAGGRRVSPFRLKYYQVLMSMQFMVSTIDAQHIFQGRVAAGTKYCTLGLGFIEYTANSVVDGILDATAAREGA